MGTAIFSISSRLNTLCTWWTKRTDCNFFYSFFYAGGEGKRDVLENLGDFELDKPFVEGMVNFTISFVNFNLAFASFIPSLQLVLSLVCL